MAYSADPTTYARVAGAGAGSSGINPAPRAGQGPYGAVPGAIGMPNPFGDLSAVYPDLGGTNRAISENILSQLKGELSPETINSIKDAAATFGVTSGMPGSQLAGNMGLRNLGLATEGQIEKGIQNYSSIIPTISSTQTVNPQLQTQIAEINAINAAAPDPGAAAAEQQRLFDQYLNKLMSPAGGSGAFNEQDFISSLGPGTKRIGPNTYSTPYMGF